VVEAWNVSTFKLNSTATLSGNPYIVNGLAISPNGEVVFAATNVGLEAFATADYNLAGYNLIGDLSSVVVSPNGTLIAFSAGNGALTIAPNPFKSVVLVKSITLSPTSLQGGASSTATVTSRVRAPSGGTTLKLSSTNPAATVPSTVLVRAGGRRRRRSRWRHPESARKSRSALRLPISRRAKRPS